MFANVIVPVPIGGLFTYAVPESMERMVKVGSRVRVSFGAKEGVFGIIACTHDTAPQDFEVKEIEEVMDVPVTEGQLTLWRWIAHYFMSPIGEVLKAAIPTAVRNKAKAGGVPAGAAQTILRAPVNAKPLTAAQQRAHDAILTTFETKEVTLLHGVTSSGKTEIYIHLIKRELEAGHQVLYLLPEIALTVQITERLKAVFGERIGIYHSRHTDAERARLWWRQRSEQPYDIILGARSAMFLPFDRLGLVIIDEEQDSSYKQHDPAPRYHGRSTAIMLARMHRAKTLLGTATPCMETYHNAFVTGKYGLVGLYERYAGIALPEIHIVDTAQLRRRREMTGIFSPTLLAAIREALEREEQVILFHNRRGYSTMMECRQCGWIPRCATCDVTLTYHRAISRLACHYCGQSYGVPQECPACGGTLARLGIGTEKLESSVQELFPTARVARMDLDTTKGKDGHAAIIAAFAAGYTDILIGTQMVSKGLDFSRVSVVGILDADTIMNYPDFRAYEQAFIMFAQVSGRAGRSGHRGTVILQTRSADNPLFAQVVANDYRTFYSTLAKERIAFHYPPYTHIITIYLKHRHDATVRAAAEELVAALRALFGSRILGPDKPPVAMVRMMSIRKIMLKTENTMDMTQVRQYLWHCRETILNDKKYTSVNIFFDVDPA